MFLSFLVFCYKSAFRLNVVKTKTKIIATANLKEGKDPEEPMRT